MYWLNIDTLRNIEDPISTQYQHQRTKPTQRWGQACVNAHNKLFIIGGYEGI